MSPDFSSIKGKCWVFGDNVDTDQIIQGRYLTMLDYSKMAKHTFEVIRPDFAASVKEGDVIVAGKNFGAGSSREEAPMVLRELGVNCIVAESFARIFYRNAFNVGLPVIIVPKISDNVREGDELSIDLTSGEVKNLSSDTILQGSKTPKMMLRMLKAGGAVALYRKEYNS